MRTPSPHSTGSAADEDYDLIEEYEWSHITGETNDTSDKPRSGAGKGPHLAFDDNDAVQFYDASHNETLDNGFHAIDGSNVPSSHGRRLEALPAPLARQTNNVTKQVTKVSRAVMSTPNLIGRAASAAGAAVKTELMNTNPAKLSFAALACTGAAAGFAVMVNTTMQTAQGIEPADHGLLFKKVEDRLRLAGRGFSNRQKIVVNGWIEKAKKGLKEYATNNYATLTEKATGGKKAKKGNDQSEASRTPKEITFGTLLHGSAQVSASRNPSIDVLFEAAPNIANTLLALRKFLEMPWRIQTISGEELRQRKLSNPLFGATAFTDELNSRANVFFENAMREQESQLKKNYIASSSPGTGKTLNIEKVAKWLKQPIVTLTGADFNNLKAKGKPAWDVFEAWVKDAVTNHMQVAEDNTACINGFILLDDFHFALEGNGHFAYDRDGRVRLRNFLKDLADPAREHVLSDIELAPDHSFPVNTGRVQAFMTLNRLPRDFDDTAEEAFRSRTVKLKADSYPTPEDRKVIAENWALAINCALAQQTGMTADEFDNLLDKTIVADSLQAIAKKDIEMAKPYDGRLGVRGLADMLSLFQSHVKSNAERARAEGGDYSRIYSLEGFDLDSLANSIGDYKKGEDARLASMAEQQQTQQRINAIRNALPLLNKVQRGAIESILPRTEGMGEHSGLASSAKSAVDAAEKRLGFYRDRIPLPGMGTVRTKLLDKFGYLKSSGENGEADRFAAVYELVANLYFRRAAALHTGGDEGYEQNLLIRVTLTDASAWDPSFFDSLADTLGGVPLVLLTDPTSLFTEARPLPVISKEDVRKIKNKSYNMYVTYTDSNEESKEESVGLKTMEVNDRHYVYGRRRNSKKAGEFNYFVINSEVLQNTLNGYQDQVAGPGTGVHMFSSTRDLAEEVHPRPKFIDHVLGQTAGKASAAEAMAVVLIDDAARATIGRWAEGLPDRPADRGWYEIFEEHLYRELNAPEVTLQDGSRFDARSLTFVLLHVGTATAFPARNDGIVQSLLLGPPPVEGRRALAESTLHTRLADAVDKANHRKRMLRKQELRAGELTGVNRAAFDQLVEFDKRLALRGRAVGFTLPTTALQQAVSSLAGREAARLADHFGIMTGEEPPAEKQLAVLAAEWNELYAEHARVVKAREEAVERGKARDLEEAEARAKRRVDSRLERETARPAARRVLRDTRYTGPDERRPRRTSPRPLLDVEREGKADREASVVRTEGRERSVGRKVQLKDGADAEDGAATALAEHLADISLGAGA